MNQAEPHILLDLVNLGETAAVFAVLMWQLGQTEERLMKRFNEIVTAYSSREGNNSQSPNKVVRLQDMVKIVRQFKKIVESKKAHCNYPEDTKNND